MQVGSRTAVHVGADSIKRQYAPAHCNGQDQNGQCDQCELENGEILKQLPLGDPPDIHGLRDLDDYRLARPGRLAPFRNDPNVLLMIDRVAEFHLEIGHAVGHDIREVAVASQNVVAVADVIKTLSRSTSSSIPNVPGGMSRLISPSSMVSESAMARDVAARMRSLTVSTAFEMTSAPPMPRSTASPQRGRMITLKRRTVSECRPADHQAAPHSVWHEHVAETRGWSEFQVHQAQVFA